jgi:hypothetical protein
VAGASEARPSFFFFFFFFLWWSWSWSWSLDVVVGRDLADVASRR